MKSIDKSIFKLAIPSILANITVPLVGMVDMAVVGHLNPSDASLSNPVSTAAFIGGITIGSMLFDLLYWNFAFLRAGTGGLTSQAYGRNDRKECSQLLGRAVSVALICSILLIAIQWLFLKFAFVFIDCSEQVRTLASSYFSIRIWAAPATLSLMAFKGWFIGMQDSVSSMILDIVVNGVNIVMSILLTIGFTVGSFSYAGMGFSGVAAGTVLAQYSGLAAALIIIFVKYRRSTFGTFSIRDTLKSLVGGEAKKFFSMNVDLFVRSLCFIAIYIGYTTISAAYGDDLLATCAILMKLLMLFSYFTDGFAYAGEALTGKYIGAGDEASLFETVKRTFVWSMAVAMLFMVIYAVAGDDMLRLITSDEKVIAEAAAYLPWLLLMPIIGCAAFTWDGIYIGATATKPMRNSMLWATFGFFVTYFISLWIFDSRFAIEKGSMEYFRILVHLLMAAYFIHLVVRTIYLSIKFRKSVFIC